MEPIAPTIEEVVTDSCPDAPVTSLANNQHSAVHPPPEVTPAGDAPVGVTSGSHYAPPDRSVRKSATLHANLRLILIGRMGPFSKQAHFLNV